VCVFLSLASPPTGANTTQGTTIEGGCMVEAWTVDGLGNHYSRLQNNSLNIGLQLYAITDCENGFNFSVDGVRVGALNGGGFLTYTLSTTNHRVDFENNEGAISFQNLTFYPNDMMSQAIHFYENPPPVEGDYWTSSSLRAHEFWVAIVTVICSLVVSLFVVDRFSKFQIERQVGLEITEGR